jgi:hypothetical protein
MPKPMNPIGLEQQIQTSLGPPSVHKPSCQMDLWNPATSAWVAVEMRIDTGADASMLSADLFHSILRSPDQALSHGLQVQTLATPTGKQYVFYLMHLKCQALGLDAKLWVTPMPHVPATSVFLGCQGLAMLQATFSACFRKQEFALEIPQR